MTDDPKSRPIAGRRVEPVEIVRRACAAYGDVDFVTTMRASLERSGIVRAVRRHDNARLFAWLMEVFNFQGVSDAAAAAYLAAHGSVGYRTIGRLVRSYARVCPRLASFEAFAGCGYVKSRAICNNPAAFGACPVPTHALRKGALNQAAYSLFLFIRDRAEGDLVAHIDRVLAGADVPGHPDRVARMRVAIVDEIIRIYGVSHKVINMAFADLLLGAERHRPRWFETGAAMIAIDTLVHNFLRRTGIHHHYETQHVFGATCYGRQGCERIIDDIARAIDARSFNRSFPAYFPRFVQHAIWRLCAGDEVAMCNSRMIDDSQRCEQRDCSIFSICGRVAIAPSRP